MGSSPSKVTPVRSRSGLSFVSTSSVSSLDTIASSLQVASGVQNLKFDDVTIKSFHVSWDPPPNLGASCYQVRLFPPDKIKSRTLLRAHRDVSHTFTRLHAATHYSVAVVAIDPEGNKSPCETASVFTLPRPPRNLKCLPVGGSDSMKVEWKHCKGKRGSYEIEVTEDGEEVPTTKTSDMSGTSKTVKGLIPGTVYIITLRNVIKGARSEAITERWMTAPRHVCDVTFSDVSQHEMTLKWKKPEGRIDSYTLQLTDITKKNRKPTIINKLTKTSYTFNGLTPGRVYSCSIECNAGSKKSKPQLFNQCTVPSEVAGITARDVGPEEALVTWVPGTGDADDYDLFLSPKEGVMSDTAPRGITKTEYKFTGLVPGTVYTIGVVTNSKDKTSKRVVSSFATVPGMVGDLEISTAERSCTTQQIKWPPASGRMDSYVISVRREDKLEDGIIIKDVFQPHYLLTDLTPGTLYRLHVAVMRDGRESSSVSQTFGTIPASVQSIFFTKTKCSFDKISVTWEPSVGGVEKYHLSCTSEGGKRTEATVSSEEMSYTFSDLHPSCVYDFAVTAISNNVASEATAAKQVTGPGEVVDFKAVSLTKREINLSWNPPVKGAEDYFVTLASQEDSSGEQEVKLSTTKCEHAFVNLIPGSLYQVTVTPTSNTILGKSTTQQIHTKPGDVMNVHIPEDDVTASSILVTWWGVEGASKNVDVTLTRLRKNDDDQTEIHPTVIKEEHVVTEEDSASQVEFAGLEANTVYGIRLRSSSRGDVGNESVFTQSTKAEKIAVLPDKPADDTSPDGIQSSVNEIKVGEEDQITLDVKPDERSLTESSKEFDSEKPIQHDKNEDDKTTKDEITATPEETPATVTATADAEKEIKSASTETSPADEQKSAEEQITETATENNTEFELVEIVPVTEEPLLTPPNEESNSPSPPREPENIVEQEEPKEETDLKPSLNEESQPFSAAKKNSEPGNEDSPPTEKEPPLEEKQDLEKNGTSNDKENFSAANENRALTPVVEVTVTPEPVNERPKTPTPDLTPTEKSFSPDQDEGALSGKDIKPIFVLPVENEAKGPISNGRISREHSPRSPKKVHQPSQSSDLHNNGSTPVMAKKEEKLAFLATLTSYD